MLIIALLEVWFIVVVCKAEKERRAENEREWRCAQHRK